MPARSEGTLMVRQLSQTSIAIKDYQLDITSNKIFTMAATTTCNNSNMTSTISLAKRIFTIVSLSPTTVKTSLHLLLAIPIPINIDCPLITP